MANKSAFIGKGKKVAGTTSGKSFMREERAEGERVKGGGRSVPSRKPYSAGVGKQRGK